MLDARIIGSYISKLRKERDLTQVNLAEHLSVSHQAVSKWERGESIPDIDSLHNLSKLFGKSVDQLLNGSDNTFQRKTGELLTRISNNQSTHAAEMINERETSADDLVDAAPLLKASELRRVTQALGNNRITFSHVLELAPFLDEETLDDLLKKVDIPELTYNDLMKLAPFLREETLSAFMEKVTETLDFKVVMSLAPFLHKVEPFIQKVEITNLNWDEITAVAPFVQPETLDSLLNETFKEPLNIEKIIEIAPFLGENIDRFLNQFDPKQLTWLEIMSLAPFLDRKRLSKLTEETEVAPNPQQIVEMAPFLTKEHLNKWLQEIDKEPLTPELISSIAPFVEKETLSRLINKVLG